MWASENSLSSTQDGHKCLNTHSYKTSAHKTLRQSCCRSPHNVAVFHIHFSESHRSSQILMSGAVSLLMSMCCAYERVLMRGRLSVCLQISRAAAVVSLFYTHQADFQIALKSALPPESTDDTQLHENCSLFPKWSQCPCLIMMFANTKWNIFKKTSVTCCLIC